MKDHKETFSDTIDEWDDMLTQDEYIDEEAVPFMQVFKKPSKTQIRAVLERFELHYRLPIDSITLDEFFLVYHKLSRNFEEEETMIKRGRNNYGGTGRRLVT